VPGETVCGMERGIECEYRPWVGAAGMLSTKLENRPDFETSCYLYATCTKNIALHTKANPLKRLVAEEGIRHNHPFLKIEV